MSIKDFIKKKPILYKAAFRVYKFTHRKSVYVNKARNIAFAKGKKGVVYTCIVGEYDSLHEPLCCPCDLDFVAFTDRRPENYQGKWKTIEIPEELVCKLGNRTLINRYIKLHPYEFFGQNYDYSIYVDGNITVLKDLRGYFREVHTAKTGLGVHRHYRRQDIYEEGNYLLKIGVGNSAGIKRFMEQCKEAGMPEKYGLYEACVIAADLHNSLSKTILDEWFDLFVSSGCMRDQMILPYIIWRENLGLDSVANLGNSINLNPLFFKNQHSLKSF